MSKLLATVAITAIVVSVPIESQASDGEGEPENTSSVPLEDPISEGKGAPKRVSAMKAFSLSLFTTAVGQSIGASLLFADRELDPLFWGGHGVFTAAVSIGPSLGHYYLGNNLRATGMMLLRGVFCAAPIIYLQLKVRQIEKENEEDPSRDFGEAFADAWDDSWELTAGFAVWAAISGAVIGTLAAIDCVSAWRTANRRNAEQAPAVAWQVAPVVLRTPNGHSAPGGMLTLRF